MPSHHPSARPRREVDSTSGVARRFTPARIPRAADEALIATFEAEVAHEVDAEAGPRVGVIDTGVVSGNGQLHPFLQGHVIDLSDDDVDVEDRADPGDSYGHGTFVAGVILREAPTARIHMKAALDVASGEWEDDLVARAIRELGAAGVTLINLSFCGNPDETETPGVIVDALEELGDGVVVVAAAGNNPSSSPVFPAAVELSGSHPQIIAVGAVDTNLDGEVPPIADFSGFGGWVDAYANGRRVFGPHQEKGWILWSGTSFACATVTGRIAAAMVRSGRSAPEAAAVVLADGPKVAGTDIPYIRSAALPLVIQGKAIPAQG